MERSHTAGARPAATASIRHPGRVGIWVITLSILLMVIGGFNAMLSGRGIPHLGGYLFPSPAMAAERLTSGAGQVVVIDPGHGGTETGAKHVFADGTTIVEKDLNLSVALKVADRLAKAGYHPILTRTTDSAVNNPPQSVTGKLPIGVHDDLQARVDIANNAGAKLFLSIHFNGHSNTSLHGAQIYYCADGPNAAHNQRLATLVLQNLLPGLEGVGYPTEGAIRRDVEALRPGEHFYVLSPGSERVVRPIAMPAVLAEGLFVSNPDDAAALRSPEVIDAIAHAYALAVHQYFTGDSSALPVNPPADAAASTRTGRAPAAIEGTVATDSGIGALLRTAPTTEGEIVRGLPENATVDLLRVVTGQAADPGDDRWYLASFDGTQGYVYAPLVQSDGTARANAGAPGVGDTGTVQTESGVGAYLRAEPSTASAVLKVMPDGATLDLVETTSGESVESGDTRWFRVRYDGSEGYVYGALVQAGSRGPETAPAETTANLGTGRIQTENGTGAMLRAEPDTGSGAVGAMAEGASVTILQLAQGEAVVPGDGRWYRVSAGGSEGYVYGYLVKLD